MNEEPRIKDEGLSQMRWPITKLVIFWQRMPVLDALIDLEDRQVLSCEIDDDFLRELNITLALAGAAVDAALMQRGLPLVRPNVKITFEEAAR
jgi:hypothetical protein